MPVVWHSLAVDHTCALKMLRINTCTLKNKGTTKHCQNFENFCMVKNFKICLNSLEDGVILMTWQATSR